MADQNSNKERFIGLCKEIKRDGIDQLLNWLEKSDFYTAPASTKHHEPYPGGLLEHSLRVYDDACYLHSAYPMIVAPPDSIKIAALFHDLCKVNFYAPEKKNRKNEQGQWESYDSYTVKEKFCFGGHGSKSVFLLQNFIRLTPDEAVAINCHMSCWDGNKDVGTAYERCPFAWLIHVADESATFIKPLRPDESLKPEEPNIEARDSF